MSIETTHLDCQQPVAPLPLSGLSHPLVQTAHDQLLTALESYMSAADIAQVSHACLFGDKAHIKDKRKSGEPYITHPIAVAEILAEFEMDVDTIIAAILHDTIEDTEVTKEEIIGDYGETVANLVDGVTKLKISSNKQENKAATFSKILSATLDDSRVIIIKLADRLHNMSTLHAVRLEKRISTAQETMNFYLPFARIMGLNELANRIELLCLENFDPTQFDYFQHQLNQRQLTRQHRAGQIQTYLFRKLAQLSLSGSVTTADNRADLFRQFFKNKTDIKPLLNSYHFTVVLDTVKSCDIFVDYLRHRYRISTQAIQDNIRKPYPGGYQALNLRYEYDNEAVQLTIQTEDMQKVAQLGAMLGENTPDASRAVLQASLANMHALVDQECAISTTEALLNYLHNDKVLVYTCHGDLLELPLGSTVLDFGYNVREYLGHHAIGATVDGKAVKLATKLETGQKVTMQIDPLAAPNADWLSFLVTAKARKALQSWLRQQTEAEQLAGGKDALKRALKRFNHEVDGLDATQWENLFKWQQVESKDAIYKRIALGNLLPQLVVSKLFSNKPAVNPINANVNSVETDIQRASPNPASATPKSAKTDTNLDITTEFDIKKPKELVLGTSGVELHYGNCCNPIFGDAISGELTPKGLVVHRFRCNNLTTTLQEHPQHVLGLQWNKEYERDPQFSVILRINAGCNDTQIEQMTVKLHELNAGVNDIFSEDAVTYAYVVVKNRNHVAQLVRELRAMLGFPSVKRLYHFND